MGEWDELTPITQRQRLFGRAALIRKREEIKRMLDSIPQDTRSLAQRAMGEPIWERSALYKKEMGLD